MNAKDSSCSSDEIVSVYLIVIVMGVLLHSKSGGCGFKQQDVDHPALMKFWNCQIKVTKLKKKLGTYTPRTPEIMPMVVQTSLVVSFPALNKVAITVAKSCQLIIISIFNL